MCVQLLIKFPKLVIRYLLKTSGNSIDFFRGKLSNRALFVVWLIVTVSLYVYQLKQESYNNSLLQQFSSMQKRLQYLQSLYKAKHDDVVTILHYIDKTVIDSESFRQQLTKETEELLQYLKLDHLHFGSQRSFMPHIEDIAQNQPVYRNSRGRDNVTIVMGIPTVKRDRKSYLLDTLTNMIESMSLEEKQDTLIIVCVGETRLKDVLEIAEPIYQKFQYHFATGLLEIISPPVEYYPDMNDLHETLGDEMERVQWRSKQNLDFAYLMSHGRMRGKYFLQLEDDIVVDKGFVTKMNTAIQNATDLQDPNNPWYILDFCGLGSIGRLFKSTDLAIVINMFYMFYNNQPGDWLSQHIADAKICNYRRMQNCKEETKRIVIKHDPPLIHHVGLFSSLKGKVQRLKN